MSNTRKRLILKNSLSLLLPLVLISIFAAFTLAQQSTYSRGIQTLDINYNECVRRAQAALNAEGYTISDQGGDNSRDHYVAGLKSVHTAIIACNIAPEGKTWANIFISSQVNDRRLANAERLRLQALMAQSSSDEFSGVWVGPTGDGRFDEVWTISRSNGQYSVSGNYFERGTNVRKGGFTATNVSFRNGVLSFTQLIDKPVPSWSDRNEVRSVTVSGDTLNFSHQFGNGTLKRRR